MTGTFGQWLKQRRKDLGYTQQEVADRARCSLATIEKVEAGKNRPSPYLAEALARALDVPPDDIPALVLFARGSQQAPAGPQREEQQGPEQQSLEDVPAQPSAGINGSLTPLVGREHEVESAVSLLARDDVRLLTLTGPGGIGKTRLAAEVASSLTAAFPGGVFFVPLAPVADPLLVPAAIARALGIKEAPGRTATAEIVEHLGNERVLLLLDNFEQVISAAPGIADLLGACNGLKVLATSREALRVRGERQMPVPPLDLPAPEQVNSLDPEALLEYPAIRFFVERARAARPGFAARGEQAKAAAAICARLDGLPLAIELAAARVRLFTPQALLARLDRSLSLLTTGPRDLPARQQTLRAAIDWSYNLIDAGDQRLFARLGVFAGGCDLGAAEAVCNAFSDLPSGVLDGLASLIDKSLVRREDRDDLTRFSLLETLREYAAERLSESGEEESIRRLHAEYYLGLAQAADIELRGARQAAWLRRLSDERDNIEAALEWCLRSEEATMLVRLVGLMWRYWWVQSHITEWSKWMGPALERRYKVPGDVRARVAHGAGILADSQGDYALARNFYVESLALRREMGDKAGVAIMLNNLGHMALSQGDVNQATVLLEESLQLEREAGDSWGVVFPLMNLGRAALQQGDYARAQELYEESLALRRAHADTWSEAIVLQALGLVAMRLGNLEKAARLYDESLRLQIDLGSKAGIAGSILGLAEVALADGQYERGATLLAAAEAIRDSIGTSLASAEQAEVDRVTDMARSRLNYAALGTAWQTGKALTLEQVIEYALLA